jgi:hypothetical protein
MDFLMLEEQRRGVIAKLVGARNEIEDALVACPPGSVLLAGECAELSTIVRALDNLSKRVEGRSTKRQS